MENAFLVNGKACSILEINSHQSIINSYSSLSKVNSEGGTVRSGSSQLTEPQYSGPQRQFENDCPVLHLIIAKSSILKRQTLTECLIFVSDIIALDSHNDICKSKAVIGNYCKCKYAKFPYFFILYYVERDKKRKAQWCLKSLLIESQDSRRLQSLFVKVEAAFEKVKENCTRPRNLLVIVNPYGGAGKGIKIWERQAKPLLRLADIELDITLTERAGHAFDLCYNLDWSKFDGIVAVGGDGILNECIHAFAARKEEGQFTRCPIPFGLIPAGSTNCINEVVTGVVNVTSTCLQIITGQSLGIDVIFLRDNHSKMLVRVSFCSVAYGFFGDVLIRSEKLRCIGPIRYIIAGALSFMHLRTYRVETEIGIADVPHWDILDDSEMCVVDQEKKACSICDAMKDSREKVPVKRVTHIKARVAYLQVVANSCACKQSKLGISPTAHLGDGTMDVVFACETKCKHLDALRMLFIHNTKADRFGVDFMRPYRASHVKIKVLPPKETSMNETKEGGQAATTATASRSNFTSYLTRKTSAVFSSSSTRHKNKKRHQTPKNNGVGSSQPGCPPSPAMASGAPPTEHSESSRGEDEDEGANMVSVQPNDPSIQAPNRSRFRDREASPRVISGEDSDMGLMPQVESEINDALNTGEDSLDSESGQRVFTFISGRRFGRYRNRHEKAERRELRMKEKAAAVAAMAAVDKDINEHSNMHYCSDDAEGAGDCEISRAPSLKPDSFSHMWIDTENMNALWNIDGEICESNVLTLEPQCQFVSFFGARPPPPPSALHSKGGKQRGEKKKSKEKKRQYKQQKGSSSRSAAASHAYTAKGQATVDLRHQNDPGGEAENENQESGQGEEEEEKVGEEKEEEDGSGEAAAESTATAKNSRSSSTRKYISSRL